METQREKVWNRLMQARMEWTQHLEVCSKCRTSIILSVGYDGCFCRHGDELISIKDHLNAESEELGGKP